MVYCWMLESLFFFLEESLIFHDQQDFFLTFLSSQLVNLWRIDTVLIYIDISQMNTATSNCPPMKNSEMLIIYIRTYSSNLVDLTFSHIWSLEDDFIKYPVYYASSIFCRLDYVCRNIFSLQLSWVILIKIQHYGNINTADEIPVCQLSIGKNVNWTVAICTLKDCISGMVRPSNVFLKLTFQKVKYVSVYCWSRLPHPPHGFLLNSLFLITGIL